MPIERGFYRHYTGFLSFVHGVTLSASNRDSKEESIRPWVLYSTDESANTGHFRRRPMDEFLDLVMPDTGVPLLPTESNEKAVPRFMKLPVYPTEDDLKVSALRTYVKVDGVSAKPAPFEEQLSLLVVGSPTGTQSIRFLAERTGILKKELTLTEFQLIAQGLGRVADGIRLAETREDASLALKEINQSLIL